MLTLGALALGAGISATGALAGSALNAYFQNRENNIMRDREDNAISRRVRDLEASGLSPTLAAGSPASSGLGTAPNVGDGVAKGFDFASKYMSLIQQKADISQTNSQVALNELMAGSEKFKQAFLQAQTEGENLRNNWINAEKFSELDLRDKQGQKIGEEMKRIVEDTALLKARTAYEQANTDFVKTQRESELINQDILMNNRAWNDYLNASKVWQQYTGNKANLLGILGGIGGASSILEKQFPQMSFNKERFNWYVPKRLVP